LENTIHVRNLHEDIEQTSVDDKTTYANDVTSKEISFSDIAIGDFVVAMGTKNGNQVLSAGRVLVSKTPVPIKRQIHIGDVIDISGNTLKLAQSEEEVELKFPKNWKGPEKSEMDPETRVAAITNSEGGDTIRTIQILN
jgi:hypothetical protein